MYQQRKDPANSIRIWTQNDYEIKTGFEKITNASKKFNQSVALLKISELVEEMHQKKTVILDKGNYKITFSSLLFVAKEILLHTSDSRGANISVDDLGKLCDIYHLISDPIVDGQRSDIPCIFIKMIYEQAIWQQRTRYFLPRSLLLFSEMHEPPYDYYQRQFETIFQKHFDISIRDFIILSVASSFCVSKYGGHFRDNFILNAKIDRFKSIFTPEKLDNFLNVVTLTNVEFRKYQSQYLIQDWREKKYEFNCLRTYPLIKNNNREIICPIPRLLLDRCTVGLYYELFNLYKKKDGDPYDFTKKYGEIFEHYIGILLKEKYQYGVNLFKAEEHLHCLTNQKIPDWIIYENDSVIIIECKSSHLPLKVLQSSSLSENLVII